MTDECKCHIESFECQGPVDCRMAKMFPGMVEERNGLRSQIERLTAERYALREALGWYGEKARLCRLVHSEGDEGRRDLAHDGGTLARAVLANQQIGDLE